MEVKEFVRIKYLKHFQKKEIQRLTKLNNLNRAKMMFKRLEQKQEEEFKINDRERQIATEAVQEYEHDKIMLDRNNSRRPIMKLQANITKIDTTGNIMLIDRTRAYCDSSIGL